MYVLACVTSLVAVCCVSVRPSQVQISDGQQLCVVCSDLANGLHFGAITCEGCKVRVLVRKLQGTCTRTRNTWYMYSCDGCKVRLLVLGLQSTWTYLCVSCKVRVLVRELQGTLTRARTQVFRLHDSSISIGILILFVQRLILKHQSDRCDLLVDYTIYFMTAVDIYCDVYLEVGRTCSLR